MPPVVSFIGWHNSGKTTLTSEVVSRLKDKGYRVAVIKSTKETGIEIDQPRTDTAVYRRVGADSVALWAPDQLIIRSKSPDCSLLALAQIYYADMDIVVAEGFKHAAQVPKIEVKRDGDAPFLRDQVEGVIAVVTDQLLTEGLVFRFDQVCEIADCIEARFLHDPAQTSQVTLNLHGIDIPLPESLQKQLALQGVIL